MLYPGNFNHYIKHCFLTGILLILVSCSGGISEQQMLKNAKSHLEEGRLIAAAIELQNTVQKNSNNAEARFLLGNIELEIGYLTSAEKEFNRAELAGWDEQQTKLALARVLIARNKYQQLLDDINIKNSWSATARANITALRALAYAGLDQTSQAKITLDESQVQDPDAFQVLKTTANFQITGILNGDAADTLKKALSLYPDNPEFLLLHATNDLQNKNITRAAKTYKKIIDHEPANLITRYGRSARIDLARLLITEKHYDRARATLKPVLAKNHSDPVANYLSSLIAFSQGDYNQAEMYMRKLLKIVPNHVQSQQLMGNIKFALNDYDQAAHYLTNSLAQAPDNLLIYKLLTRTYMALNKPSKAESTIQSALSINPNDAEALSLLSQLKYRLGDTAASIDTLAQAIKLNPKNSALYKQLVIAYIKAGETDKALSEIKNFQRLSKNLEEARKLSIRTYLQAGNVNKAIELTKKLLINDPQNPEIISLIGELYATNNNPEKARAFFNRALQIEDNFPAAIIGLARLETDAGNFDKAITLYQNIVDANKSSITPLLALADLAAQQGRTSDMLRWLEKAREASATDIKSRAILASYYLNNAQAESANKYIQEAIKISPEQTELLSLYGKILMAQERYSEALPVLKMLIKKLPKSTEARILIGKTYLRLQMSEPARNHLLVALNNNKNNDLTLSLLADAELKDNEYDKSLEYALRLQKISPDNYAGYMQEGKAWLAKQVYNKALGAFNKAAQLQKTPEIARLQYTASKHIKSFENAIIPLLSWLDDNPDDNAMRFFLAFTYLNAERNKIAIQEYEKILKNTPEDGALLNNLAWLYSMEDNPKALSFAEKAFRLSPEDPGVLDTYGWVLVQQGQTEKGQRMLHLAMKKLPNNPEIQYHYAAALIQSGDIVKGRQILKKSLSSDKSFVGRHDAKWLLETTVPTQQLQTESP